MKIQKWLVVMLLLFIPGCSGDEPTEPETIPTLTVAGRTGEEGYNSLFTVSLSEAATGEVIFWYHTEDGTATQPDDYISAPVTIDTIEAGEISDVIEIVTVDDTELESSETFSLIVSNVTGAKPGDTVAIGTISDNDAETFSGANGIQALLKQRCALNSCHGGESSAGGLALGTVTYGEVIAATGSFTGGLVVVPNDGAASSLYTKTTSPPQWPNQMPSGLQPLSTIQQNQLRDWIDQGALNN